MADEASAKTANGPAAQVVEIDIESIKQANNNTSGSQPEHTASSSRNVASEMPTVTTLLQRKKLGAGKISPTPSEPSSSMLSAHPVIESEVTPPPSKRRLSRVIPVDPEPDASHGTSQSAPRIEPQRPQLVASRQQGVKGLPPQFKARLALETIDLKGLKKAFKKHRGSPDMKKLDVLGYFSRFFTEITFFLVKASSGMPTFEGIVGYGNMKLVTQTPKKTITADMCPSLFAALSQQEVLVAPIEGLRNEDKEALENIGFSDGAFVGAFPVISEKTVSGVWICMAQNLGEIPSKELKELNKVLSDLEF